MQVDILVVEDDKSVAFFIQASLKSLHYNVLGIVDNGDAAIEIISKNRPSLVLMDIMILGDKDGIETAQIIKDRFNVPVIYMTAFSNDNSIERAKATEPYGYLIKPFELKELKSTIEIALYKNAADKKQKEADLWFKTTLESIGDGVIATDSQNNVKFMNHVAEKLCGYSFQESNGQNINMIYNTNPDVSTEAIIYFSKENPQNFMKNLSTNKILSTKNGSSYPIEEKISSIVDENGNVFGKVITFRDTSKRRETELAVLAAKDFYLNILEKFPVLIWRANKDKQFNYFNSNWIEFTGSTIESQIYQGWLNLIHPEDRDRFANIFKDSFDKKIKFETDYRLLASDAKYHWLICAANPIYDLNDNFEGYIGVCLDYTNRKILEDELRKAKEISDAANQAKSMFISNMSHELRTPLNGIMGLTDLLLESRLEKDQIDYLNLIKESSNSLLGLLNNLLDFSKIVDKKEKIEIGRFSLKSLISDVVGPMKSVANRNGVDLEVSVDESVSDYLEGDDRKIQQVLSNLLSNAVKFTPKGKIVLSVYRDEIHKIDLNKIFVHFVVSDTGIGIPKEKQELIFESFTQVDGSITRKYSGCGLGLAIVKRIVEILNGKIWFESEFGKGSSFHFIVELKKSITKKETNILLN